MPTAIFLAFVAHRALSGLQNGAHYGQRHGLAETAWILLSMLTVALCLPVAFEAWPGQLTWRFAAGAAAAVVAFFAVLATEHSFDRPGLWWSDVHFWTSLQQYALGGALWLLGVKFSTLLLAIYPALFLQKLAVNLAGGQAWDHRGTDDPSGRTFYVPLLELRVPRLVPGMRNRLWLAIASFVGFLTL